MDEKTLLTMLSPSAEGLQAMQQRMMLLKAQEMMMQDYGNYIKGMEYKSRDRKRALDTDPMPLPLFLLPWFSRILIALGLRKRASTLDYLEDLDRWLDKKLASS